MNVIFSLNNPKSQEYKTGGDLRLLELVEYTNYQFITPYKNFNQTKNLREKLSVVIDLIQKAWKLKQAKFIVFEYYTFFPLFVIGKFNTVICLRKDKINYDGLDSKIRIDAYIQEYIGLLFAKKIIVQSEIDKKYILERHTFLKNYFSNKIKVQNNNINTNRLLAIDEKYTFVNPKIILDKEVHIGFVGQTKSIRKNFEFVIKCLSNMNNYSFNIHLIGDIYDGSVNDIQIFSYGKVNDLQKVVEVYKKCHFMIIPSLSESFSNIITESLYFRIPLLCSAIETHQNILGNRYSDVTFELEEHNFKNKLMSFLKNYNYEDEVNKNEVLREKYTFNWAQNMKEKIDE